MLRYLIITTLLSGLSFNTFAAKKGRTKLKTSDIQTILKTDAKKNLVYVRAKSGKLYKMRMGPAQRQKLAKALQLASSRPVKALPSSQTTTDEFNLDLNLNESSSPTKTSTATRSAASAQVAAKASEVVKEPAKSPWGVSYFNITSVGAEDFSNQQGNVFLLHQLTISYKLNSWKFAVKPVLTGDFGLESGAVKNKMSDIVLEASNGSLYTLPWEISASNTVRLYLPTGESSRDIGQKGLLYTRVILGKKINPIFSTSYTFSPRFYFQSQRANATFDPDGRLIKEPKANRSFRLVHSLGLEEKINDWLSLEQSIGLDHGFRFSDPGIGLEDNSSSTSLETSFSASFSLIKNFSFTAALEQSHNLGGEDNEGFAFLKGSETSYTLYSSLSF